jgi:hypothetical protein
MKMITEVNFLYRGVSKELHKKNNGRLIPKGDKFTHMFYPSNHLYPSRSIFPGECEQNAVVTHQSAELMAEQRFRSAGISTTPIFERAKYYATHIYDDSVTTDGYVYIIDRSKLDKFDIEEKIVSEVVESPQIPEDNEVILVSKDRGTLPTEIIIETLEVAP